MYSRYFSHPGRRASSERQRIAIPRETLSMFAELIDEKPPSPATSRSAVFFAFERYTPLPVALYSLIDALMKRPASDVSTFSARLPSAAIQA